MNKNYTDKQKQQLATLYKHGHKVKGLCLEYGISKTTMYRWIKEYQTVKMGDGRGITPKDYYELQRSYHKVKIDYNILKECDCTTSAKLVEILKAISSLDGRYTIHALCRVLGVRRSTYYHYKLRRPKQTEYDRQDILLKPIVKEVFEKN